jgi:hypothetical protein
MTHNILPHAFYLFVAVEVQDDHVENTTYLFVGDHAMCFPVL